MNQSPYHPPAANVADQSEAFPRKRNAWIWIILVYQAWGLLGMIFSYFVMRGGLIPIPKQLQQYYNSLGVFDWVMSAISFALVLLTIIYLFKLNKLAVRFFIAELLFSVFMYVVHIFRNNLLATQNEYSWVGVVIGYAVMLLVLSYLLKLQKRGVLQ